jgi:hypothetical protein
MLNDAIDHYTRGTRWDVQHLIHITSSHHRELAGCRPTRHIAICRGTLMHESTEGGREPAGAVSQSAKHNPASGRPPAAGHCSGMWQTNHICNAPCRSTLSRQPAQGLPSTTHDAGFQRRKIVSLRPERELGPCEKRPASGLPADAGGQRFGHSARDSRLPAASPANVALPLCWIPTGGGRRMPSAWGRSQPLRPRFVPARRMNVYSHHHVHLQRLCGRHEAPRQLAFQPRTGPQALTAGIGRASRRNCLLECR